MKTLADFNFSGKKVLVRVDYNVPLDKNTLAVTDDTRLKASLTTLNKILSDGGALVLMSHLGRPKEGATDKYSLRHIVPNLSQLLGREVLFVNDCISEEAFQKSANLKSGQVLLLENLRFYQEEEKGDVGFAEKLSKHGDVYVNDAFGTAHRAHASTSIIARFFEHKICGYLMQAELDNAEKVLNNAEKPFTAVMGGAKVSDKILIIERLLEKADNLIIGGAMAYTFFKAKGGEVGTSRVEVEHLELANEIMRKAQAKGVKLILPVDSLVADKFAEDANTQYADNMNIPQGFMGLDIGEKAVKDFSDIILQSKTILWNGPMGVFEMPTFAKGTTASRKPLLRQPKTVLFHSSAAAIRLRR